jgi:hypothetical protein
MVLDWRGLPRSATEAPSFFFDLKNPTAVNAFGAETCRDGLAVQMLPKVYF